MVKRFIAISFAIFMILSMVVFAQAEEIMPLANEYFNSAATTVYASKSVNFYCTTTAPVSSLRVSYCWLQQKIDGKWEFVKHLTPPSYIGSGTSYYNQTVSYASEIGSGTFRVAATYNADGHAIAAYSPERTFP